MVAGKQVCAINPPRVLGARKVSRVRAPQWTNLPAIGPERLSALRADIERARDEYRLSHPEEAERTLLRPLRALQAAIATGPAPEDEFQTRLLSASAWTVLGRSRRKVGHPRQANAAFVQAADTFERLLGGQHSAGQPRDWADYGMALEHLDRDDEAVAAFRVAVARGLRTPDVYRHMGFALQDDDPAEAERCFEAVLELTPDDPYAMRVLAEHIEDHRPGDARDLLRQAAFGYAFHGEVQEALKLFERTLETSVADPDVLAGRAEMLRLLDRCEKAVEWFDRSLQARPATPWVMAGKAAALHRLSRNQEALTLLDQTLCIAPEFVFARGTKGRVQRALGDLHGSAETLQAIPAFDPSAAWILAELGETLRLLGEDEKALEALGRALDLMPRDAAARASRAALRLAHGDRKNAIRDVDIALERDPDSAFAHSVRGQILFEGRSFDDAVTAFKRTVDLDRRQAPYWSMLGDALRAVGRTDEALGAFKQAIDLVPTYSPALVRLGTALWEKRRFDEALEAVEKAIAINDGQYPHALAERGRILRERGRPGDREAAIDSFRQSIALDRNQPGTLVELAGLEWDRGDVGAAYEFSDAALAIAPTTVDAYVIRGRAPRSRRSRRSDR